MRNWSYQLNWWLERRRLDHRQRAQARQLEKLVSRRRTLEIQLASLTLARRLLALWHAIHIPLGMVLFSAAIIHIVAAVRPSAPLSIALRAIDLRPPFPLGEGE